MLSATLMSWVLRITVAPRRRSSRMALRMASTLTGSRPVKGSSRISSLGSGTTAAMNCTFWLMPLLSVSTRCVGAVGQAQTLQPAVHFRRDLASAPQLAVELQQRRHLHAAVQAALLRQVADLVRPAGAQLLSEDANAAAVGIEDIHDHPHGGGLARAVGADEAVNRPRRDGERQVVYRRNVAEGLRYAADFDGVHAPDGSRRMRRRDGGGRRVTEASVVVTSSGRFRSRRAAYTGVLTLRQ